MKAELGLKIAFEDARFLGVFEHFYETNRYENSEYGTHYVVLAYEISFNQRPTVETDLQHNDIRWMSKVEILSAESVHPNSKAYFS